MDLKSYYKYSQGSTLYLHHSELVLATFSMVQIPLMFNALSDNWHGFWTRSRYLTQIPELLKFPSLSLKVSKPFIESFKRRYRSPDKQDSEV